MPTNCVNCGAPLTGNKCQYCGTEYKGHGVVSDFGEDDWVGTLSVGGNEYSVYIGRIETETIDADCGRTLDGTLVRGNPITKHKFTLIEV